MFFGRGQQTRELFDLITSENSAPVTCLYGQSGVGKSSFLAAGVLPRLKAGNFDILYLRREQNLGAQNTLLQALDVEAKENLEDAWNNTEQQKGKPLIVVLDQLEEIYTRPFQKDRPIRSEFQPKLSAQEMAEFSETIAKVFQGENRPKGKLILSFRKEWLAEIEKYLEEANISHNHMFLEPLDREGIIEAVEGVSKTPRLRDHYGLTLQDDLLGEVIADDLLEDAGSSLAPTLQILLTKMWREAKKENYSHPQFNLSLYQDLKREGYLLNDFLEQQITNIKNWREDAVDTGLLLDILNFHTTPMGTATTWPFATLQEAYTHYQELPTLLQKTKELYLLVELTTASKDDKKLTKLAHDTLAPLIRENFEQSDLPGQRAKRILESRKVDWIEKDQEGKPKLIDGEVVIKEDGPVLDEQDLTLVQEGQLGMRVWDTIEKRLVEKSEEEKERKKQERLAAEAKRKALRKRFVRSLVGFSIVALILAIFAGIQWQRATTEVRKTRYALADKLLAEASRFRWESPQLALLLTVEALKVTQDAGNTPTESTKQTALEIVQNTGGRVLDSYDEVKEIQFSHDNSWLIITSEKSTSDSDDTVSDSDNSDDIVQLWLTSDFMSEDLAQKSPVSIIPAEQATFSPDGQWLLTNGQEGVKLWDISQSEPEAKDLAELEGTTQALFSHNSKLLITIDDERVIPWYIGDSEPQAKPESLTDSEGTIITMAFSKDDSYLVLGMEDNTIELWSLPDFERKAVLNAQPKPPITVGENNDFLVALNNSRRNINLELINNIIFGPENCCLIGHYGDKAIIWDLSQADTKTEPISSLETRLDSSPDQHWLVTIDKRLEGKPFRSPGPGQPQNLGYSLKLWDFSKLGIEVFQLLLEEKDYAHRIISENVTTSLFSSNNQWFLFLDGKIAKILNLNGLESANKSNFYDLEQVRDSNMVFSSDGQWLATTDGKYTRLWPLSELETSPQEIIPWFSLGHEGNVTTLDISPDSHWLVTGSTDKTVRLWDLEKGPLNQIESGASVKEIIAVACATAGRNLTEAEWKNYMGESIEYSIFRPPPSKINN